MWASKRILAGASACTIFLRFRNARHERVLAWIFWGRRNFCKNVSILFVVLSFERRHKPSGKQTIQTISQEKLRVLVSLFHDQMVFLLQKKGPLLLVILQYWVDLSDRNAEISFKLFNCAARPALSSQSSSAALEQLFSNLVRSRGNQRQLKLCGRLEMTKVIRKFVMKNL